MSDSDVPAEPDETLEASEAPTELKPTEDVPPSFPTDLPESIAGYRVVGKLGEGGMGVVFEAEQPYPKRRVALKVIRGGQLVDELQVRMFQREVETLARLKHPNIGAIYDAGRTEAGRHFFAMELVEGEGLGAYLARRPAATEAPEIEHRLRLFRQICDAVHYAHQRGVIHRDLKPSNIFVTTDDTSSNGGLPAIKILDFGLARITDTDMAAATILSEVGSIKGTLPYMSPEQARGDPAEIDLRTDVYTLGVILYQMLVGALPYDTQKTSLIEALRVICEQPPTPLRSAWTAVRRVDPDLETILGKALEKEADRRYASASALSDDVERLLASQPIQARPPTTTYQLRKLVARNKLPTAFAATVLVLLVGFGIWMSVLFERASRAEAEAKQEAETATQISDFLVDLFEVSDPSEAQGNTITAREILDRGAEKIERELAGQPVVQGRLVHTVGRVYRGLGLLEAAAGRLEKGLVLREESLGADHLDTAESLTQLGALKTVLGEYEESETLLERALETRRAALGPEHPLVGEVLLELGILYRETGRWEEAEEVHRSLLPIQEQSLGPRHADFGRTLMELAVLTSNQGELRESESLTRRGLAILEQALPADHPDLLRYSTILAREYSRAGNPDLAADLYRKALAIQQRVLGSEHPDVVYTLFNLAIVYADQGNLDEAEQLLRDVLRLAEKLVGRRHYRYGVALHGFADVRRAQGHSDEATRLYEQVVGIVEESHGPENPQLAHHLNHLIQGYLRTGRYAEADSVGRRVLAMEGVLGPDHFELGTGLLLLGRACLEQARYGEAEKHLERSLAIRERAHGPGSQLVADVLLAQGVMHLRRQHHGEGWTQLERARVAYEQALGPSDSHVAKTLHQQGLLRAEQGRLEEARSLLDRALEIFAESVGPDHPDTLKAREALGRISGAETLAQERGLSAPFAHETTGPATAHPYRERPSWTVML